MTSIKRWGFLGRIGLCVAGAVLAFPILGRSAESAEAAADGQRGIQVFVPAASDGKPVVWRYAMQQPNGDWKAETYDDAAWNSGPAPFGAGQQFVGPWRTPWKGSDIWLRRTFTLSEPAKGRLVLRVFHDEDVEVYLNGKAVLTQAGFLKAPLNVPLEPSAAGLLHPGNNTIAVHCHQTKGGQGIDVGLMCVDDPNHPLLSRTAEAEVSKAAPSRKEPLVLPDKRTDAGRMMTRWAKDLKPENVWPEYPRPAMVRPKWLNLNGLWDYAIVGPAELPKPANLINAEADPLLKAAPIAPSQWDGQILVPFAPESPLSKVSRFVWPSQLLWYRRTTEVPADWQGQRVILHFEAVDWHCVVWVNGRKVGEHKGGYVPFACDVTEALKPQGPQEIMLVVWDPTNVGDQANGKQQLPSGGRELRYPPTTGIWQTVWLEPVPSLSIERLVLTPDLDHSAVTAHVELRGEPKNCEVELTAWDGRQMVAKVTADSSREISLPIPQPKLWSPETPFLYDLKATLRRDGQAVDEVAGYFGMRKVAVRRDASGLPRIELNGKPVFLFGPLDQGIWPDGILTPPSDAAGQFEVQYLKDIGCNMARFHMIVHPERWYYWCDKLGLVVWQDFVRKRPRDSAADSSTARQWEAEHRELMDHLRNHPSLMMWIVFNESWGQYDTERITRWVMQYDPSRLVCNATGWTDYPVGHTFDVHDYSYHPCVAVPGQPGDRAMSIGECGGFNVYVPGHTTGDYPPVQKFDPMGDDHRPSMMDGPSWEKPYADWLEGLRLLQQLGLCAAVYTQIYDTGGECNGWLTYDRAVSKIPPDTLKRLHSRLYEPPPEFKPILPPLKEKGGSCRWQHGSAQSGWEQPDFSDSGWPLTAAPLAVDNAPSPGRDPVICARRVFMLESLPKQAALCVEGWGAFTVWLNGQCIQKMSNGQTESYTPISMIMLSSDALAALHAGRNVIAVEMHPTRSRGQRRGGSEESSQIDFGLVEVKAKNR